MESEALGWKEEKAATRSVSSVSRWRAINNMMERERMTRKAWISPLGRGRGRTSYLPNGGKMCCGHLTRDDHPGFPLLASAISPLYDPFQLQLTDRETRCWTPHCGFAERDIDVMALHVIPDTVHYDSQVTQGFTVHSLQIRIFPFASCSPSSLFEPSLSRHFRTWT